MLADTPFLRKVKGIMAAAAHKTHLSAKLMLRPLYLGLFLAFSLLLPPSSDLFAQWQIATPQETHYVHAATDVLVPFPTVSLASGLQYRVLDSGFVTVSGNNERADGRFYVGLISVASGIVQVGLKVSSGATNSYMEVLAPYATPTNNHAYTASLTSNGNSLSFYFFDTKTEASGPEYYADNRDSLRVTVLRETPGIAVKYDTLDFGILGFKNVKTLRDSMQSYGVGQLNVTTVQIEPILGPNAFSFTSERGNAFSLTEQTNWFDVSFAPKTNEAFLARLHITSPNTAPADRDRYIILKGSGQGAVLSSSTDTLDFGLIKVGGSKSLDAYFSNAGDSGSIVRQFTNVTGAPFLGPTGDPIGPHSTLTYPITFAPLTVRTWRVPVEVSFDNGFRKTIIVKGRSGEGIARFEADTLDFGTILFGENVTLTDSLRNVGILDLQIVAPTANSNSADFTVNSPSTTTIAAGAAQQYSVIFNPATHTADGLHTGLITVTLDNGTRDVVLIGRERLPIEAALKIDTFYYVQPGKEVVVSQYLKNDVSAALYPLTAVRESILYNSSILNFVGVEKGELLLNGNWSLTASGNAGVISVRADAAGEGLTKPGELIKIRFRAAETSVPEDFSMLPQIKPTLGTRPEPLITTFDGKITIEGQCSPPRLTVGKRTSSFIEPVSPNPAVSRIDFVYSIVSNEGAAVLTKIEIYDMIGRLVKNVVDQPVQPGIHSAAINIADLSEGTYYYVFTAGNLRQTRMLLISH